MAELVEWGCNCYDLPFTVPLHMPHATAASASASACLTCIEAAIKDSIKFNWNCPREAADCNSSWQRLIWREGKGESGCSSKITSHIWQQIACCSPLCVSLSISLFVLARCQQIEKSTQNYVQKGAAGGGNCLILISRHCACCQQHSQQHKSFCYHRSSCKIQIENQSRRIERKAFWKINHSIFNSMA